MNSNYVKKFNDYLQNIPAHKPSKVGTAVSGATDHSDTSSATVSQQPQSKTFMHRAMAKKPCRKSQTGSTADGSAGVRRPVWIVPAAGSLLPHQRPHADERKFVRTCCPSRHSDSTRPDRRVDCRWEDVGKNHPKTPSVPGRGMTPEEKRCDTAEPKGSREGGDHLADNVNHQRKLGPAEKDPADEEEHEKNVPKRTAQKFRDHQTSSWAGMLSSADPVPQTDGKRKNIYCGDVEETSANSNDQAVEGCVDCSSSSELEKQLFTFQPIRTLQLLTLELTSKLRDLGPEHRSLYKIGKELSDVVKILSQQQLHASKVNTPAHRKATDEIECANCQLLQRNQKDDRDRHAQESVQLNEQINYLKDQLDLAKKMETDMRHTVTEQHQRLEEKFIKLKHAVGEKKSLELEKINDFKWKLKQARSKEQQLERERDSLENRLMEALMNNERMEFLLHAQNTNFSRVKSELTTIHKLSDKQIDFLNDPGVGATSHVAGKLRRHRHASVMQRSDSEPATSIFTATRPPLSEISTSHGRPSAPSFAAQEGEQRNDQPKDCLLPEKPVIVLDPDSIPNSPIPPTALLVSDQYNSSHVRRNTARRRISTSSGPSSPCLTSSRVSSAATSHKASACGAHKDNEREEHRSIHANSPRSNPEHENHNCQLPEATTQDYSTGDIHWKFGEARKLSSRGALECHRNGVADTVKWQNDDKNLPGRISGFRDPSKSNDGLKDDSSLQSCAVDYGDRDERRNETDSISHSSVPSQVSSNGDQLSSPVILDDHQHLFSELAGNITLPSSPIPFRCSASTAPQLSEDDEPEQSDCQKEELN